MTSIAGLTLDAAEKIEALEAEKAAFRDLVKAREDEMASLQSDLRAALDLLAGFQLKDPEVHIRTDFENRNYTVERYFKREYGTFTTVKAAHARRREIEDVIRALPFAHESLIEQERAAISAGS